MDRRHSPDDLRRDGWSVAVHNDYRNHGTPYTFWLVTKDGHAIKGEGETDAEALDQIRAEIAREHESASVLVEAAREVAEQYVRDFANAILHGDEKHRAWLLEAAEAFIRHRTAQLEYPIGSAHESHLFMGTGEPTPGALTEASCARCGCDLRGDAAVLPCPKPADLA